MELFDCPSRVGDLAKNANKKHTIEGSGPEWQQCCVCLDKIRVLRPDSMKPGAGFSQHFRLDVNTDQASCAPYASRGLDRVVPGSWADLEHPLSASERSTRSGLATTARAGESSTGASENGPGVGSRRPEARSHQARTSDGRVGWCLTVMPCVWRSPGF